MKPSSLGKLTKPYKSPAVRALVWLAGGLLACLLGSWAWLLSFLFLILGATAVSMLGLSVPTWAPALAFVVGMPAGAWLELRFGM